MTGEPMIAHGAGGALVTGGLIAVAGVVLVAAPAWAGRARRRALCTAAGFVAVAAALNPLVDAAAERAFAWHMAQHLALLLAAPLLLVAGHAMTTLTMTTRGLGLPAPWHRSGAMTRWRRWRRGRDAAVLAGALGSYVVVVSAWHVPALFAAATEDAVVHAVEHASMLAVGVALLTTLRTSFRRSPLPSVAVTFVIALHGTALGALITFAAEPTFAVGRGDQLALLGDQRLAALLMWIPVGTAYTAVALVQLWRLVATDPAAARL